MVDITATAGCEKFINFNFAPIFVRGEITFSMLPNWMKPMTEEKKFPRKTLLQKMNGNYQTYFHFFNNF